MNSSTSTPRTVAQVAALEANINKYDRCLDLAVRRGNRNAITNYDGLLMEAQSLMAHVSEALWARYCASELVAQEDA